MEHPRNVLSHREHARLAGELISACGGLEEASRACRVRRSALSGYQSASDPSCMPADVMDALEDYADQGPTYSGAISERRLFPTPIGNLAELACEFSEVSLDVQGLCRRALADGNLSPREVAVIHEAERDAEAALERLKAARRAIEQAMPTPLRAA